MNKNLTNCFLISALVVLTGCDVMNNLAAGRAPFAKKSAPVPAAVQQPLLPVMDSPDLAKMILKTERKPLKVSRDPFKPIVTRTGEEQSTGGDSSLYTEEDNLDDVILIGVINFDGTLRAYLKTKSKTGVFKIGDKIRGYSIESIRTDKVVFKSEKNEVVKKREDK